MKYFSIISIIASTFLIGYFFIIGLPEIASTGNVLHRKVLQDVPVSNKTTELNTVVDQGETKASLEKREACNAIISTKTFKSGAESDMFLEKCLAGDANSNTAITSTSQSTITKTTVDTAAPRLTKEELVIKCNDFMSRAKFDSQKSADSFLANCLAGK